MIQPRSLTANHLLAYIKKQKRSPGGFPHGAMNREVQSWHRPQIAIPTSFPVFCCVGTFLVLQLTQGL